MAWCLTWGGWILLGYGGCNNTDYQLFDDTFVKQFDNSYLADTIIYLDASNQQATSEQPMLISGSAYNAPVGRLKTTDFGTIEATSYIQMKPVSLVQFPATHLTIDSCSLSLKYETFEGDSTKPLRFSVYEVTDEWFSIEGGKNYNQNNHISINRNKPLGSYQKRIDEFTVVASSSSPSPRRITVPIDTSWGKKFVADGADTKYYTGDSAFMSYFKGFALVPSSTGDGVLAHFKLQDTNSFFVVHYSYEDPANAGGRIQASMKWFYSARNCAFATEVKRDKSNSNVGSTISQTDPSRLFLQPYPNGSIIYAILPKPLAFLNPTLGVSSISRAEILLEEAPLDGNVPPTLSLIKPSQIYADVLPTPTAPPIPLSIGLDGIYPYDFAPSSLDFGGIEGYYIDSLVTHKNYQGYKLNVTRYIQKIAVGKSPIPYAFRIMIPYRISYNLSPSDQRAYTLKALPNLALSGIKLYGKDPKHPKSLKLRVVYLNYTH